MTSLANDPVAAAKVTSNLKDLFKSIGQVEEARKEAEETASSISDLHSKLENDQKVTPANRNKLKQLYEEAVEDAEKEEESIREALDKIYNIRQIRHDLRIQARNAGNKETIRRGALMKMLANSAETIPLWVGKDPPPLCGSLPAEGNYVAKCGDMAAALVRGPDGDENWILAEVVAYNSNTSRYCLIN